MKDFIKDIIIAVIIVAALTAVIKPTIVKESSMENTLFNNNYLFVNKLAYKLKDHPDHGDIVVFKSDIYNEENGDKKLLIKRVIATEGETVTIEDGYVFVDGVKLVEPYTKEEGRTYADEMDIIDYQVPENQVFCMGDNREVSLDSRSPAVGTVSEDAILGKAFIRLYPFDQITTL